MSKSQNKAKPYDPYAPPPQTRKASQQGGAKFYDGPTVSAKVDEVTGKTKAVAKTTSDVAKRQGRKAASAVRRHPWSFVSILTTIPFLLTLSLFSTVVCPPPDAPHSPISRIFLTPLGLHDPASQHSALHQTLCYPANVYQRDVLQPYVYPIIEDLQQKATAHPIYKSGVQPAYTFAQNSANQVWEKPLKPVVDRIVRGARRVYLTFIDPHVPYFKAKAHALTAPYTSRISALHNTYVSPHLTTASQYAQAAGKQSTDTYKYVASHPLTDQAGKYAGHGYRFSRAKGQQAYEYSKPHAIRAGKEAERITREILGPRVVAALQVGYDQVAKGGAAVKLQVTRLYYAHIDPYVGPHIAKLQSFLAPYSAIFQSKIYTPYILPVLEAILPPAILAPEPPKSFWALVADILPSLGGGHVAEHKGQMDDYYKNIDKSKRPADVPVPGAAKVAKAESATKNSGTAKKMDRAEMERVREAIRSRVDEQGKKGLSQVREELLQLHSDLLTDEKHLPALKTSARAELEREFTYILTGLDKLYTSSTSLTKEQIAQSSAQADGRVSQKVKKVKERVEKIRETWFNQGKPVVKKALDALDAALGTEYTDLATKMAWIDDINPKDWTRYNDVKSTAEAWADKYVALHKGETKDRALNAPSANYNRALATLNTELDDLVEAFRDRVSTLKRSAQDRVEARDAIAAEVASPPPAVPVTAANKAKDSSAPDSKVSILPIVEAGAGAAAAAGGIIGKGKDQILDALSQASSAALGEETTAGVVDQAKASVASAYDAASSGVHDATRSIISAAGATPSPEGAVEHLESLLGNVQRGYASIAQDLESTLHDATRAGLKAVAATPSPEGVAEHAESILSEVSASASSAASDLSGSAASAYDAAGSIIHDGTRSAIRAVGATPTPESIGEHAESLAAVAAESLESVAAAASSVVHDATRSAIKAVGATPSPKSPVEHAQSLAAAASSSIDSAASAASSVVHDATRSAIRAVGGTPSPESPREYAESVADQVASSASSVYDAATSGAGAAGAAVTEQASILAVQIQEALGLVSTPEPLASTASAYLSSLSAVAATGLPDALASGSSILASLRTEAAASIHSATRAASKAAGLKPTPETPKEHLEQVGEAYKEARRIAESLAGKYADSVSTGVAEATASVKQAVGRDEL